MKRKLIKRRIYEIGKVAYFNSWNEDGTKSSEILSGEIIKVTEKFCTLYVKGQAMRKAKHNIYFSADDLKLKILQEANDLVVEKFGMDILQLNTMYDSMSEKLPEKFV